MAEPDLLTPAQIGQQLSAAYVLADTLRRSGLRLRISAQLVDTHTDFPLWSERYDRELQGVFELQDEIARKIAEALRITLSPQEQSHLAAKPTENLQSRRVSRSSRMMARSSVDRCSIAPRPTPPANGGFLRPRRAP